MDAACLTRNACAHSSGINARKSAARHWYRLAERDVAGIACMLGATNHPWNIDTELPRLHKRRTGEHRCEHANEALRDLDGLIPHPIFRALAACSIFEMATDVIPEAVMPVTVVRRPAAPTPPTSRHER